MGNISINTNGSFGWNSLNFSAMQHGHAHAVAEAITFLSEHILPKAIALDHKLQSEGSYPSKGFKGD